jgi:UPF0176 protein
MPETVNIAAYKFVTLDDLPGRQSDLRSLCNQLGLKGTILLSAEGINLFLAGTRPAIDQFLAQLRAPAEFADLEVKESLSDRQPFTRMLVRIKREIIAFGVDGIAPADYTSARIAPKELKAWLDEGRPVTLLDTRNDYEYQVGSFDKAVKLELADFRHFPDKIADLPAEMKDQTVVTFCTGGIRCEKAAPFMERAGFKNVYQLEGGILKYFEECGGAHYDGECFVFDQRVALDPDLRETDTTVCFACQATLTKDDRAAPEFVPGASCPFCHRTPAEELAALLAERNARIRQLADPLPGSVAYENRRPMSVPARFDGVSALDFLAGMKTIHAREQWLAFCQSGAIRMKDEPVDPEQIVRGGMRLELVTPATVEPPVNGDLKVLFEDDHLIVLDKPAPLPMHPCGRFNRNSLQYLLDGLYPKRKIRPAHRLDANTSGLVVCSKTRAVARELQPQFAAGRVAKSYLARVHNSPPTDEFESTAPISREPAATGGRRIDPDGLPARTHFKVLDRFDDGTALLAVTPLTGRTNQIRLHLWAANHSIIGDPLYLPDQTFGEQQTLAPTAAPMCLHAAVLKFTHPVTGEACRHESTCPRWP